MPSRESDVEARVREILASLFGERGVDAALLAAEEPLVKSVRLDSLDAVDLAMELERTFHVPLSERDTQDATLAALVSLIVARLDAV